MGEVRRRVLPLPDEVVEEFLGDGEQVIHSDHPSFRSFAVENTLLFLGFFVVAVLFLGITFNGSFVASGLLLIGLAIVFLILVLKRLGDRYTSYVVTDTRIMQIQGVVSRRAHSIPWVRVTDLTVDQSLMGRLFGYATLHIESANEDSGLRDLDGVSDPMRFNKVVVDMVVAKQGTTQPAWVAAGEVPPPTTRGLRRVRISRRRRDETRTRPSTPTSQPPSRRPSGPACRARARCGARPAARRRRRWRRPQAIGPTTSMPRPTISTPKSWRPSSGRCAARRATRACAGATTIAPDCPCGAAQARARSFRAVRRSQASTYSSTRRWMTSAVRSTRFIWPTT